MNSRQRVYRAIEMAGPDRVPIMHGTLPGAIARHGQALDDLYRRYPEDVLNAGEVRVAVRAGIDTLASSAGGLIAHGKVGGRVPLGNIEAMLDEMVRCGTAAGSKAQARGDLAGAL